MKKVISYLRAEEWLASKVPFMLGILLFFSYYNNSSMEKIGKNFIAFFLYASMFLAISYVANDFSDIEIDKKAGKKKIITAMPKWAIWSSFVIMAAVGNVYIFVRADKKALCAIIMILTYFLGLSYSALGIRFKERGIWGLIECSFAQRCMPLFMIPCLEDMDFLAGSLLVAWILLSFIDGIRYIIIHQVIDLENDRVSGVKTYVAEKNGSYRHILLLLFLAEAIMALVLLVPLWIREPFITGGAVIANLLLEYCIYRVIHTYAQKDILLSYDSVPLEAFLNIVFPVLTAVCLAVTYIYACVLVLALLLLCAKAFIVKCEIASVYILSIAKKGR